MEAHVQQVKLKDDEDEVTDEIPQENIRQQFFNNDRCMKLLQHQTRGHKSIQNSDK